MSVEKFDKLLKKERDLKNHTTYVVFFLNEYLKYVVPDDIKNLICSFYDFKTIRMKIDKYGEDAGWEEQRLLSLYYVEEEQPEGMPDCYYY